ncbi:TetR/AcrR family transcriptional regulator, partial [Clostridioides difficile]|uniref:TetR/AcrR family transcriptional regulator n=1 Tax=Clostridioides difficile TaxID=1496 RepID=UPI00115D53BD
MIGLKRRNMNYIMKVGAKAQGVSVSMIAEALGMTKGALYKHYKNKQDIFDCIVERMYQIDNKR